MWFLWACASKDDGESGADTAAGETGAESGAESGDASETDEGCTDTGSAPYVVAPTHGAAFAVGEVVELLGGGAPDRVQQRAWYVDDVLVAETVDATWVAAGEGEHIVRYEVVADCYGGSDEVTVMVAEPGAASVTVFDAAVGLPTASWYGLTVDDTGVVWGATSAGLVRFDPLGEETTVYGVVDGLTTDYPRSVVAHSDGTLWVGHVADSKRQGEQIVWNKDGTLTVVRLIDYLESTEITSIYRLQEQPYGVGAGDVWMGANEGVNVWDADLGVFAEHAHPTHPHGISYGVAFTDDGHVWNGDEYQLSRYAYSNDGDLSPSSDLVEFWVPWPVDVKSPIAVSDMDSDGDTLWVASSLHGVATVEVSDTPGFSVTTPLGEPFPATASAVRLDPDGRVFVGTSSGLYVWDPSTETMAVHTDDWLAYPLVQQIVVDPTTLPATTWVATPYGLTRLVGVPE